MPDNPLLLVDGHNLLFRACFGTPAQIWSRDPDDKRELTTEFMFFALLRRGINEELPGWPEVVVVFDGQDGSAQRKQTDAGYKANRPADDNALKPIRALLPSRRTLTCSASPGSRSTTPRPTT
jgi:DNA polymerase I